MNKYELGDIVTANGWPAIVIEANRSTKEDARVMCAVFGWEVDFGSVWVKDTSYLTYDAAISQLELSRRPRFEAVLTEYREKGAKARARKAKTAATKN